MLAAPGALASQLGVDYPARSIEQRLASAAALTYPNASAVSNFYGQRNFEPIWIVDPSQKPMAMQLIDVLRDAASEGLSSADYRPDRLESQFLHSPPEERAAVELAFTHALLGYVADLRGVHGRSAERELRADFVLAGATAARDLRSFLKSQAPTNPMYRRLRRMLAQYRKIESDGGWPMLTISETLKAGMNAPQIDVLRRRLEVSGDITVPARVREHFDQGLEMAVQRYQKRVGLEPDGVVGPKTRANMNISAAARVDQIQINLDRWRDMPEDLGERHVLVNIAGFELEVVEQGEVALSMPVIVGKPQRSSPVFSDEITHVVLNPSWSVPARIARVDILRKLKRNPDYLRTGGFSVYAGRGASAERIDPDSVNWSEVSAKGFPYKFRQAPGSKNALGRVKFMFPNKYSVYLHDTSSPRLFQRRVRAFSSGCIRVSQPLQLARHLLQGEPNWADDEIDRALGSKRTRRVNLTDPVPVHLTYSTAWLGEGGSAQFRDDIYGRDAKLLTALKVRNGRRKSRG